jgi:(4-O-methyl)-D-glucuronate---lignin esterase
MTIPRCVLALSVLAALPALSVGAQTPPAKAPPAPAAPANPFQMSPEERERLDALTRADHADMMRQLGITRLRPGYNGWARAGEENAANYDPVRANPYPDWPDVLTLKDGRKVATAQTWWQERRLEIAEDFEREVYGRVPQDVPGVTWAVTETVETTLGGQPVVARRVIGHVDDSAHPAITVDIKMAVVVPVHATGPVPVLVMFGWGNMPDDPVWRFPGMPDPVAPPSTEQLVAAGWGYVSLSPASIQADNGAGLTSGIIGLANRGKRRTPEQWGALRAWAWGAARALDYLETLPAVDAKRVGIEGVSRYGKAALVTMAFEPRFAVALVGSSGEGGAKPHRRHFGEAVENLTGSGAYHWMAGNFLKYGAEEASFGSRNAGDIPVDAHELIALCAPRPTFISYGVPEKGDANWLDQQGSYMAAVAASPVFDLLGARGLGVAEDYRAAKMPPVNTDLLDGELAWRQHDGGHEDRSNMSSFIAWANRLLHHTPPPVPADEPRMRLDRNSHIAHQQLLAKAKSGGVDLCFLGDSITRRWGALDYPDLLAHWNETFHGWNAANFGWGGDRTENILWRLDNGELDGVAPKVIVLQAGTNNIGRSPGGDDMVADITRGLRAIVDVCRKKAPGATIVLTAIFPRGDNPAATKTISAINANLAEMADGASIRFLDVNDRLADAGGALFEGMTVDGLHPSRKGYEVWAEGLRPVLTELLGPPAAADHAPAPTGDPSALEPRPRGQVLYLSIAPTQCVISRPDPHGSHGWDPSVATSSSAGGGQQIERVPQQVLSTRIPVSGDDHARVRIRPLQGGNARRPGREVGFGGVPERA